MTKAELEPVVLTQLEKLYRIAARLGSFSAEAEDLVGATLCVAFKQCHQCDGRFPFAWLVQIMRHQHLHAMRGSRRNLPTEIDMDLVVDASAHHRMLATINEIDILAELDRLPEEYRLAVALCDMEELDYSEAALALGVPVGTIRSRLSRGRKLLQARLAGWSEI